MRRSILGIAWFVAVGTSIGVAALPGCGGSTPSLGFGNDSGTGGDSTTGTPGTTGVVIKDGGATTETGSLGNTPPPTSDATTHTGGDSGGIACPTGLQCNVSCTGTATTTITGTVYDPAGKDPLYGVAVYVPATPLTPLPKGVPTGTDACSCGALYPSGALTNTTTAVNGSFTLTNVPVGTAVPLVLQIGKWRRSLTVNVTACTNNAQAPFSLTLPSTVAAGDTDDNMPDIAVSTGSADTLECLLRRIGIAASEYVPGASPAGHVHVFSGGDPGNGGGGGGGGGGGFGGGGGVDGQPEAVTMSGSPQSSTSLWASQAQLMPYDLVLLSCEGGETYDANPAALESYLNVGGRAFASHYHYAWFSGPLDTQQNFSPPADWNNLASWSADDSGFDQDNDIGGIIQTTLNGSAMPFPKGLALSTWLDENGALGGVSGSATELPIYQPRYNATVSAANTASQPWIAADSQSHEGGKTMYFSFDTPVNATTPPGATTPAYCGRAVFSDLHVSGNPSTADDLTQPPPASCDDVDLSPQEKALEFMLFDLSSCVVPDTVAVQVDAALPPPPGIPK